MDKLSGIPRLFSYSLGYILARPRGNVKTGDTLVGDKPSKVSESTVTDLENIRNQRRLISTE